jgi:hypothetical protein
MAPPSLVGDLTCVLGSEDSDSWPEGMFPPAKPCAVDWRSDRADVAARNCEYIAPKSKGHCYFKCCSYTSKPFLIRSGYGGSSASGQMDRAAHPITLGAEKRQTARGPIIVPLEEWSGRSLSLAEPAERKQYIWPGNQSRGILESSSFASMWGMCVCRLVWKTIWLRLLSNFI